MDLDPTYLNTIYSQSKIYIIFISIVVVRVDAWLRRSGAHLDTGVHGSSSIADLLFLTLSEVGKMSASVVSSSETQGEIQYIESS